MSTEIKRPSDFSLGRRPALRLLDNEKSGMDKRVIFCYITAATRILYLLALGDGCGAVRQREALASKDR